MFESMLDYDDMSDIEKIRWMELRFGFTKTVGNNPSNDQIQGTENQLMALLSKYREELKITIPLPRVRIWITNDKLNFMFFDRRNNKRILLASWLKNEETYHEH